MLIQHCRVDPSPGAPPARWWQEAQEEELHDPEEDQAQAQEGEAGRPQVLPRGRQRQDPPPSQVSHIQESEIDINNGYPLTLS